MKFLYLVKLELQKYFHSKRILGWIVLAVVYVGIMYYIKSIPWKGTISLPISVALLLLPIIIIGITLILPITLTLDAITQENENKTIKQLLLFPIKRKDILLSKYLSAFIIWCIIFGIAIFGLWIGWNKIWQITATITDLTQPSTFLSSVGLLLQFLLTLNIMALCILISSISKTTAQARAIFLIFLAIIVFLRILNLPYYFYIFMKATILQYPLPKIVTLKWYNIIITYILEPLPLSNIFDAEIKLLVASPSGFIPSLYIIWRDLIELLLFCLVCMFFAIRFINRRDFS